MHEEGRGVDCRWKTIVSYKADLTLRNLENYTMVGRCAKVVKTALALDFVRSSIVLVARARRLHAVFTLNFTQYLCC